MDASVDSLPYYDKELEIPGEYRLPQYSIDVQANRDLVP